MVEIDRSKDHLDPSKLRPMRGEVIARCIQPPETTKGGIWTPDYSRPLPTESEVLKVGAPRLNKKGNEVPLPFKPGDRVFHDKHKGRCVHIQNEWFLFLKEEDIVAYRRPNDGE